MRRRAQEPDLRPTYQPRSWNGLPAPVDLAVAELEARLTEPGVEAWSAIEALAQKPEPAAFELLCRCARSPDWCFRRIAVEVIGKHSLGHLAAERVLSALDDPSAFVVRTACAAAVRLGLVEAHDRLLALMGSGEAATRQVAVRAIAKFWQPNDFA